MIRHQTGGNAGNKARIAAKMRAARKREALGTIFWKRMRDECTWRYIRYSAGHPRISSFLRSHNFCPLIHLSTKHREVARGAAVSPGTSRFTANLFRGVNHATLIFTQLCSPAQGAAAVPTSAPTCPRSRPEAEPPPFCRRSHRCTDLELPRLFP